jgi:ABC-type phosphate transport system substrate-binding protein
VRAHSVELSGGAGAEEVHRLRHCHGSAAAASAATSAAAAPASNSSTTQRQGQQDASATGTLAAQGSSTDAEIPAHIQRELTQLRM